ncbi:VOC family protein [Novosphingobium sp. Gsoil 351]|uniref:VOC family protein n=1 Tax=Novosphingobium sp. Gsoil 351 TaxID=2675225 RepID=UPI0018A86BE6|nr:VOC family protein [Novosphingobium sp. Gsoil 351]
MHDPWANAAALDGLAIDHIGIVVRDLAPTLAWLRGRGFRVNDGVPLMGADGPLGQISAHCVFANGYVEISTPVPGSGNHLEPLLAQGEGVCILALATSDAAADHARLGALAAGRPRASSRRVQLREGEREARFVWFPLTEVVPGAITAVVEHRDPDIVFAAELREHPNGATRLADVLFGAAPALPALAAGDEQAAALLGQGLSPGIAGFSIGGCTAFADRRTGFHARGLP